MRRLRSDTQLCELEVGPAPQSTLTRGQVASYKLVQDPHGCECASTGAVRDPTGVLGAGVLGGSWWPRRGGSSNWELLCSSPETVLDYLAPPHPQVMR